MNNASTPSYDNDTFGIMNGLLASWQRLLGSIKHSYAISTDLLDELLINASEEQINNALERFVVKNVGMILELRVELHQGYLRLYCTADLLDMHVSVASDFKLTQACFDRHVQRFVFEQIAPTDILVLHTKTWWRAPLIRFAVRQYQKWLKKDPLPFLLSLSPKLKGLPFIEYKGNIIYLEIGRWLSDDIKSNLRKLQVNNAVVLHEQLLLKASPNFGEILNFGDMDADIITEKDNPQRTADS